MGSRSTPENEFLLRNLNHETPGAKPPEFDYGRATKLSCGLGLGVVWLVIVTCIVGGIICIVKGTASTCMYPTGLSFSSGEGLSLGVNVLLTLCIEVLGYIQGTSLRWGLFWEGRLEYNTNIRLFRCARKQPQNSLLANIISAISLILCYGASSRLFIAGNVFSNEGVGNMAEPFLNGVALLSLALGLGVKAILCTWIMLSASNTIVTWSSDPLNNTLAAIHHGLEPRPNRCMISVHQAGLESTVVQPLGKQQSAGVSNRTIRYIIRLAWMLPLLALILFAVLVGLAKRIFNKHGGSNWHFSFSWTQVRDGTTPVPLNAVGFTLPEKIGPVSILILGLFLQCVFQGVPTLCLHAMELIVNISRDEDVWRSAARKKAGARLQSNAFILASFSWQTIILFIAKALLHWLLGQTLYVDFRRFNIAKSVLSQSFFYNWLLMYIYAFGYSIGAFALAIFTTFLAYRKPKGPQPAAFGHFQTLANLIDDWTGNEKGLLWWGDKGAGEDGVRHAGTSSKWENLGQIHWDTLYAG